MWGYRLKGSLDELHVYKAPLNPATIPRIGGLLGAVRVATSAAMVMLLLTLLTTSGYLVVTMVKLVQQVRGMKKGETKEPQEDDEQSQESQKKTAASKPDVEGQEEEHAKVTFVLDEEANVEAAEEGDSTPPPLDSGEAIEYSPLEKIMQPGVEEGFGEVPNSEEEQVQGDSPPDTSEGKSSPLGVSCRTPEDIHLEVSYLDDKKSEDLSGGKVSPMVAVVNVPSCASPEKIPLDEPDHNVTEANKKDVPERPPTSSRFSRYLQLPDEEELQQMETMNDGEQKAQAVDFTEIFFAERSRMEQASSMVAGTVLNWILALKEEQATKKKSKSASGAGSSSSESKGKGSSSGVSGSEAANSGTTVNAAWQILSQMLATMEFPQQFAVWSGLVHFLALDFTSALGAVFGAAFIGLSIVGFICFAILAVIQCLTQSRSRSESEAYLIAKYREWRKALDDGEEYKQKSSKKFRLTLIAATVLSVLYTPLTNLSISSLFCAPAIMCIFDCYNDPAHQVLVGVSVPVLVLLVLGFPLLLWYSVHKARVQYDEYIGTFDPEVKARHWDVYVDVTDDPFASNFLPFRHESAFFQVFLLLHRTLMALAIVALPSESLSQFVVTTIIQVIFSLICLKTLPYRKPALNGILCAMQLWITLILLLRSVEFLTLDSASVGIAMSVLTGIMVAATVLVVIALAGHVLYGKWKAKKEKAKQEEEESSGEGKEEVYRDEECVCDE